MYRFTNMKLWHSVHSTGQQVMDTVTAVATVVMAMAIFYLLLKQPESEVGRAPPDTSLEILVTRIPKQFSLPNPISGPESDPISKPWFGLRSANRDLGSQIQDHKFEIFWLNSHISDSTFQT